MTHIRSGTRITAPEAKENQIFADAALALAGHHVTDPVLKDIVARAAHHAITADEAIAEIRRHVQRAS